MEREEAHSIRNQLLSHFASKKPNISQTQYLIGLIYEYLGKVRGQQKKI